MCNTTVIERQGKAFVLHLGICMQQWTGLYVDPEIDRPETYEDENKRFVLTKFELARCVDSCLGHIAGMRRDASKYELYERAGFTYAEVHKITAGGEQGSIAIIVASNSKYQADEDLMFLHTSLGELWYFVFMARDAMSED
jgi:hypothetical protein